MADTEIWEQACERVDVSKRGRCGGKTFWFNGELRCDLCRWTRPLPLSQIQGTIVQEPHDIPAPVLGDPAAVVAMLKWLFTIGDIDNLSISVDYTVKDGHLAAPPWMVSILSERGPLSADQQWTLPLALAAAVCALPEAKP